MSGRATRRFLGILVVTMCTAVACDDAETPPAEVPAGYSIDPPTLADRPVDSLLGGTFESLGDYRGIAGRAQLIRHYDGRTTVELYADGLAPNIGYGVHVHELPCGINQGGRHYKIDPTVEEILADNEIWPVFTTNDVGVGTASLTVAHTARGNAQSVVIHDPMADNTKMACAELRAPTYSAWQAQGTFGPFASATEADGTIGGTAAIDVSPDGTRIEVMVSGLRTDETYRAHVHALPCHVTDGGGHYKIDPTIADTVPDNELWPGILPDASGAASATLSSPHPARPSAQSIVIHRVRGDEAPKVACATLVRRDYAGFETTGRSALLPIAVDRGYSTLSAEARLTRQLDGSTDGFIAVQGAEPGEFYPVHLHAYSCAVDVGGGHYKIDPAVQGPVPENELWLDFQVDANGNGFQSATIPVLARPEATAFVIHDFAEDGARIACIDLK